MRAWNCSQQNCRVLEGSKVLNRRSCEQQIEIDHVAYFLVHSLAVASNLARLLLQSCAISGTKGSSGLASVSRDEIESSTFEIVRAGDHWSLRMSRQIDPFALMLGWYILVMKLHLGGLKGQSVGKWMFRKKTPPEYGLSSGPTMVACQWNWSLSWGPAEQLAGGSFWRSASSFWILFRAICNYDIAKTIAILKSGSDDATRQK